MKTPYIVSSEFLFFHCLLYGEYITVAISFLVCAVFLSSALAVLVSTLIGCSVGVMLDER